MKIENFPSQYDAPYKLQRIEGGCGLLTAWGILRYFEKQTSSSNITKLCRYTKRHGVFVIALAIALRKHNLSVEFFTDNDPNLNKIEQTCYPIAKKIGVKINPKPDLDLLLGKINSQSIAVVLYMTSENNGHLTPLLGINGNNLILPFTEDGFMPKDEFLQRWSEPEICRQSLLISL